MTEVEILGIETWASKRVIHGPMNGKYQLVASEVSLQTRASQLVWWCEETGSKIEERCETGHPYNVIFLDFDGTVVDSEGQNGLFAVAWRETFKAAGVGGSDEAVDLLKRRIYKWDRTLLLSVQDMIHRIKNGVATDETSLTVDEVVAAKKILTCFGADAGVIANEKENIGRKLLVEHPERVLQLAPFSPGALEFIKKIPKTVPIAIISGSRAETTILPILEAHVRIGEALDRDVPLIGEDTIIPTSAAKPDGFYYQVAAATAIHNLHLARLVPPRVEHQDMIFIGDRIAQTHMYDIPGSRVMHHIAIGLDESEKLGPLAAGVKDFSSLNRIVNQPTKDISEFTLHRLALTLAQ